jgi:hypothetical protein
MWPCMPFMFPTVHDKPGGSPAMTRFHRFGAPPRSMTTACGFQFSPAIWGCDLHFGVPLNLIQEGGGTWSETPPAEQAKSSTRC